MGRANQLRNPGVRQTIPILHLSELPATFPGVRASEQATGEGNLFLSGNWLSKRQTMCSISLCAQGGKAVLLTLWILATFPMLCQGSELSVVPMCECMLVSK